MLENEGIPRIPWRSKRTSSDVGRLNQIGRNANSDEGLARIDNKAQEEADRALMAALENMNFEERLEAMKKYIAELPEFQDRILNLDVPTKSDPVIQDLTPAALREEILTSGPKEWRRDPFGYLAIADQLPRKIEEMDRRRRDLFMRRFGGGDR